MQLGAWSQVNHGLPSDQLHIATALIRASQKAMLLPIYLLLYNKEGGCPGLCHAAAEAQIVL